MNSPIIIAEFCQNHNGSFDVLMQMLDAAAEAGADYAKIQSIRSNNLTKRDRFEDGAVNPDGSIRCIKRPYAAERERLQPLDLTLDQESRFVDACKKSGIKSMTTIFDRATVAEIASLGFDAAKIASYDCSSMPLIEDVAGNFPKMFLSTGACSDSEIVSAAEFLRGQQIESYFLHCVTIYPTPKEQFHLARLHFLSLLSDNIGLSSHPNSAVIGIKADKIALSLGAGVIERHFTILPGPETRDGPISIDPGQLAAIREFAQLELPERKEIVRRTIPDWADYLGSAMRELSHQEFLNRDYYRGRFASPLGDHDWKFNWE